VRPLITAYLIIVALMCAAVCFEGFWSMSGNRLNDLCASSNDTYVGMGKWSWFPFGAACSYSDPAGTDTVTRTFTDRGTPFFVALWISLALLLLLNIKSIVVGLIHLADDVAPPADRS